LDPSRIDIGDELPPLVRGPMTIGDLVAWQAAIGPAYRAGALGYRDALAAPHSAVKHPITGWPVKDSQQHEDFLLAPQRGMPVPFDNGVMRFAWICPLLTDWMSDEGTLQRLTVRLVAPHLYGDTTWYRGTVARKTRVDEGVLTGIRISGANQLGETTTIGEAVVFLPLKPARPSRAETRSINHEENHSLSTENNAKSVNDLIREGAARRPTKSAVISGELTMSYAELVSKSERLGASIRRLGVAPDRIVGVALERGADYVAVALALFEIGATLLPLDAAYPAQRLKRIIDNAAPDVLLTCETLRERIPQTRAEVITVEKLAQETLDRTVEKFPHGAEESRTAYVLYTSGSTGEPVGVSVPHSSLSRYVRHLPEELGVNEDDVFVHTASFAFSASIRQLFMPLCLGATVIIANDNERMNMRALFERIKSCRATVWDTVPAVWRQALDTFRDLPVDQQHELLDNQLRLILLTGEALTWDLPAAWRHDLRHPARIINLYSQTETAGTVACYCLPAELERRSGVVPLGRPIAGASLHLLDEDGELVPVGEVGEIVVSGRRLAGGYLRRPDLTARRFVPISIGGEAGERMYRTGDLGRRRADGLIEFAGRSDDRLKLRGYRIEPNEIASALCEHAAVRQAAIIARPDPAGHSRLVAYVVPNPESAPAAGERPRFRLPNNLAVAQLNRHETEFTYRAIFEDQTYLRHGIRLHDGQIIFDVGANIGLFALFAHLVCHRPRIFAFEANPVVAEILSYNAGLYGLDLRLFPVGISDRNGETPFTFFKGFSLLSGFHADVDEEKRLVRTVMFNQQKEGHPGIGALLDRADEILDERFSAQILEVPVRTLSSVIDEEGVDRIGLLKVNVEKSELEVLHGIRPEHWERIEQAVIKVDVPEKCETIRQLFESHGFQTAMDRDVLLEGSRIQTVYAVREGANEHRPAPHEPPGAHKRTIAVPVSPGISTAELHQFAKERLPEYMVPSAFVFLPQLPRSPNGKIDRHALPDPVWSHPEVGGEFSLPQTALEQALAALWAGVLGVERVGTEDDFLELGGDSIKAMQILNGIRKELEVDLPAAILFSVRTIAALARVIESQLKPQSG
jgi:amino acid adenylation domain-containing protein/FkbM family methyltransferase